MRPLWRMLDSLWKKGRDMSLTFRSMNPGEGPELKKLAQKSFGPIEGLFVTKPKTAIVAALDEKMVGEFVYQVEPPQGYYRQAQGIHLGWKF